MKMLLAWIALVCPLFAQPFRTDAVFFRYERGASAPAAQTISLSDEDTRSVQVLSVVGPWLKATALNDPSPARLQISVDPAGLTPGIQEGAIGVLVGGDFSWIRVQLTVVDPPSFLINPKSVIAEYTLGGSVPDPATVYVSAYNQPVRFTAESNAKWLSVSPASAATPANLRLAFDTSGLTAGDYTATVTLKSDRISATIPVTLRVKPSGPQAPTFTGADVLNQASWLTGPLAPGELIIIRNIKGGSPDVARTAVDPGGRAQTLVGKTRVLFDGLPGPVLFVAAGEVRGIVPYEVEGKQQVRVQLEYNGQLGPAVQMPVAPAAPGIFTNDMNGLGQAVAAHYNPGRTETFPEQNGPQSPAQRGAILLFFLTGAGQMVPAGVTGQFGPNNGTFQLPASVLIGGKQAMVVYAGAAPGQVSGISQINVQVPADSPTGPEVPLSVVVGGTPTRQTVTVAVRD